MKRSHCGICVWAALGAACNAIPQQAEPSGLASQPVVLDNPELGDVTGDGVVNIVDALTVAQYVQGMSPPTFRPEVADANCDGAIDNADADLISGFYSGVIPALDCQLVSYHGTTQYTPYGLPTKSYHVYRSPHFAVYAFEQVALGDMTRLMRSVEAAYLVHAEIDGAPWVAHTEYHAALGAHLKTIAFLDTTPSCAPNAGACGDNLRVELAPDNLANHSTLGSRERNWIIYYELSRGVGLGYPWFPYLYCPEFDEEQWNNDFAHSTAIACSEWIGTGAHHPNVTSVSHSIVEWENPAVQQSWVDLLVNGPAGPLYPYNFVPWGGALAELYRRYGRGFYQDVVAELTSGGYPMATSAQVHACNLVQAADAVTGGDAHDLLVNQWRLPGNCGQSPLSGSLGVNPAWNTGYCAYVTVTNGGAQTTTSWTAVVDLHQSQMTNSWSASVSTGNGQLTASSLSWNGTLAPGANTTFGFCANKTGANWTPTIISVH